MSHMDGFQSREARNFTSTVCTQPEQHMPYDLPVDESSIWKPTQYEIDFVLRNISTNISRNDARSSHAQWACNEKSLI